MRGRIRIMPTYAWAHTYYESLNDRDNICLCRNINIYSVLRVAADTVTLHASSSSPDACDRFIS